MDTICKEAQSQYQAETGSSGEVIKDQMCTLLMNKGLKGHDEWACRLGHEKGRLMSVALRKRSSRSASPGLKLSTPRQLFAQPTVTAKVASPEGIGAKWVFPVLMDNQWVWLANFAREENCCCRRRANSLR